MHHLRVRRVVAFPYYIFSLILFLVFVEIPPDLLPRPMGIFCGFGWSLFSELVLTRRLLGWQSNLDDSQNALFCSHVFLLSPFPFNTPTITISCSFQ